MSALCACRKSDEQISVSAAPKIGSRKRSKLVCDHKMFAKPCKSNSARHAMHAVEIAARREVAGACKVEKAYTVFDRF